MTTHITLLILGLIFLILMSAFFSSSETAIMAVNRYRLKHLAKVSKGARRVQALLDRPDRLFGVILLGNTFASIAASTIATLLAVDLLGEKIGVLVAPVLLTLLLLIFGEVSPKTVAAIYPEKVAFPTSFFLQILLRLIYPLIWLVNAASNGLLRLFGISLTQTDNEGISREELRTVVHEATGRIPSKHRIMLLSILDLEKVTVDDIMIPRHEVNGIDLSNEWDAIIGQLANTQHTFLPVYEQDLNNIVGVIHAKKALHLMAEEEPNLQKLREALDEPFFVPQGTTLTKQLINFQQNKLRFALVVDEYGDILGLITLEDILEEIVGEFTTNMSAAYTSILPQEDGSFLVDGGTTIRECNRVLDWQLPVDGPKTVSGLIVEHLQMIPEVGTCCLIHNIPFEIVQVQENRIKTVKIMPPIHKTKHETEPEKESEKIE
ncbi:MAG: HlyC/CorC family transporter [Candidatus Berkiellales bacterium]